MANRSAAATRGRSHTWTVSRVDPATTPVARACATNGATLPRNATSPLGTEDAPAAPPAPTTQTPTTVAVAPITLMNFFVLDMVSLSSACRSPQARAWVTAAPDKQAI